MVNHFIEELKKYRLKEILEFVSIYSIKLLKEEKSSFQVPFSKYVKGTKKSINLTILPWQLTEIAYYAILNTNDFAYYIITEDQFLNLNNEYKLFDEDRTEKSIGIDAKEIKIKNYIFGLSSNTFWYQELYKILPRFNREVELLQIIAKELGEYEYIENIIFERTSFDLVLFRQLILYIFSHLKIKGTLNIDKIDSSIQNLNNNITVKNLNKIIDYYSADNDAIRKHKLKEKCFYIKPFVKMLDNSYILVSPFTFARKIYEGVFWEIRDYFMDRKSQVFTNKFGIYFEKYVENLFEYFLVPNMFFNIPPQNEVQRADWIFESRNYLFILEQKSSLMPITIKNPYNRNKMLNDYLEKILEAIDQCEQSEIKYANGKTIIKIILLYDELEMTENILKEKLFSIYEKDVDINKYILINIFDFEWLVQILSENQDIFEQIIYYKIFESYKHGSEGSDMNQIIEKYYEKPNIYASEVINHYDTLFTKESV